MRYLFITIITTILISGCTTTTSTESSVTTLVDDVIGGGEYEGKQFELKYMNSAVFDRTLAMYALKDAGQMDVRISKGMSINEIPKRLDDIFVAAVENGAEFNLVDEKYEVKMRGIGIIMAVVSAYSNYTKVKNSYRQYIDDRAQAKLGNYIINVYYNVESGNISHVVFAQREDFE